MRRVQADDTGAFATLYDRHISRALLIARLVCGTAEHAEEAIQEGFLSVWRRRALYDHDRGMLQAWIFAVIRNCSIDIYRRNRRDNDRYTSDADLDLFAHGATVEDHVLRREESRRLQASLRGLPAVQREAIVLGYFAGLTHVQIAERLGVPLGTIKSRMRLGLSKVASEQTAPNEPPSNIVLA